MEAIKFSELPTGDRMTLQDEDGVPIIANGENRLLSWGRLKDQIAKQTHTDTIETGNTKVPTADAVESRIAKSEDDIRADLTDIAETVTQAQEKANNAVSAASTAQATADEAKADATRFESELGGKIEAITAAQGQLRTDLETETANRETAISELNSTLEAETAKREATINEINAIVTTTTAKVETMETQLTEASNATASVAERIGSIETKIENGEIGGGGEEVDLTPITERLTAIETVDNAQDTSIGELQEAINGQAASLGELQETASNHTTSISEINGKLTPNVECTAYAITFADENHYQLATKTSSTNSATRNISEYIKLNNDNTATLWEYCKYLEHSVNNMTETYMDLLDTIYDLENRITSANTRCTQLNSNVNTLLNEISTQLEEIA